MLLIDAVDGLTAQDAHIAGFVVEEGRGLVVAVNKWDAVEEKTGSTFDQYVEWIRHEAPFLDFAPIVSISAKTGQRVERVLELAVDVWAERRRRVPTGELNRLVGDATARQEPPAVKGRRPKLFYATQVGDRPADVRVLRPRRGLGPLQLPALPREPAARRCSASSARRSGSCSASERSVRAPAPARGARAGREGRRARQPARTRATAPPRPAAPPAAGERPRPRTAPRASRSSAAGAWGTTLALIVARTEPVLLLSHSPETAPDRADRRNERRLPGVELPANVHVTADPAALEPATDLVIVAVPSAHLREMVERVAPHIPPSADVLSVVKGLERGTLLRMTEVIADAARRPIDPRRIAALSGPNLAQEIAAGLPASAVVASEDAGARRPDRRPAQPARSSGCTRTPTCSASSCAAPSRTSSRSPPARPTGSASATTARPG